MLKTLSQIRFENRAAWRKWLDANHQSSKGIFLVFYKKHTQIPSVNYIEAVEEALCYGWIDSLVKKIDEKSYMQKFTPRSERSQWSVTNQRRIEKLIRENKMTPHGLRLVKIAKKNGTWPIKSVENQNLEFSAEFLQTLKENKEAWMKYKSLPPSHQKQYRNFVMCAKRPETRERRFNKILGMILSGERFM